MPRQTSGVIKPFAALDTAVLLWSVVYPAVHRQTSALEEHFAAGLALEARRLGVSVHVLVQSVLLAEGFVADLTLVFLQARVCSRMLPQGFRILEDQATHFTWVLTVCLEVFGELQVASELQIALLTCVFSGLLLVSAAVAPELGVASECLATEITAVVAFTGVYDCDVSDEGFSVVENFATLGTIELPALGMQVFVHEQAGAADEFLAAFLAAVECAVHPHVLLHVCCKVEVVCEVLVTPAAVVLCGLVVYHSMSLQLLLGEERLATHATHKLPRGRACLSAGCVCSFVASQCIW